MNGDATHKTRLAIVLVGLCTAGLAEAQEVTPPPSDEALPPGVGTSAAPAPAAGTPAQPPKVDDAIDWGTGGAPAPAAAPTPGTGDHIDWGTGATGTAAGVVDCAVHELEHGRCGVLIPELTSLTPKVLIVVFGFLVVYLLLAFGYYSNALRRPMAEPLGAAGFCLGTTLFLTVLLATLFLPEYAWKPGWCRASLCESGLGERIAWVHPAFSVLAVVGAVVVFVLIKLMLKPSVRPEQ